jgi:hypothetical protein
MKSRAKGKGENRRGMMAIFFFSCFGLHTNRLLWRVLTGSRRPSADPGGVSDKRGEPSRGTIHVHVRTSLGSSASVNRDQFLMPRVPGTTLNKLGT